MAAQGSWSMRNVDPRARQRATEAARAEGVTVGEWLNRKLLDPHHDAPRRRDGDTPEAVSAALDKLSRRIEAAEHRSTLAITGIDQSVLGLVSRLQAAEGSQSDFHDTAQAALADLRQARDALKARIEKLEQDDRHDQSLEALKTLDASLGQLSDEVAQKQADTGAHMDQLAARVEGAEARADRAAAGLTEAQARVDAVASKAEQADNTARRVQDHVNDLDTAITRVQEDFDDRLSQTRTQLDDDTQALRADVSERLNDATAKSEQTAADLNDLAKVVDNVAGRGRKTDARAKETDARVKDVEGRLGGVAERLEQTASQGDKTAEALAQDMAQLRDEAGDARAAAAIANTRMDDLAARQDAAKEELSTWMARHGDRLLAAEQATNTAIQALESSFASLEDRVRDTQTQGAKTAQAHTALGERLDALSQDFASLVEETRSELAERLSDLASEKRVEHIESRLDALADDVAAAERKRAAGLDRVISEVERLANNVDDRIAESETRVEHMVDAKLAAMDAGVKKLAGDVQSNTRAGLQRLEDLADEQAARLESLAKNAAEDAARRGAELEQSFDERMDRAAQRQADALEDINAKVDAVAERLSAKLEDVDHGAQAAVNSLSQRMGRLSDNVADGPNDASLEERIRESEQRTQQMLEDAMARVHNRIDSKLTDDGEGASRVGAALTNLTQRLETLEQRHDHHAPAPSVATATRDLTDAAPLSGEARQGELASDEFIFEDVSGEIAPLDDPDRSAISPDDSAQGPAPHHNDEDLWSPFDDAPDAHQDAHLEAEGDSIFDVDDTPYDPMSDREARTDTSADHSDPFASYPDPLDPYAKSEPSAGTAEDDADFDPTDRGDDADEAVDVYDDLVRRAAPDDDAHDADFAPALDHPLSGPGFGPAGAVDVEDEAALRARRNGRTLMIAASGAAFLAVGAAAYMVASENAESRSADDSSGDGADAVNAAASRDTANAAVSSDTAVAEAIAADERATDDDPVAQYSLGVQRLGEGRSQQAFRLLQRAADAGYAPAQFRLGQMYEAGRGAPQNLADARRWTERAAQTGHREAMHNLGVYYANGIGVPESYEQAARWFKDAARLDNTDSQYNLGVLYEQGLGVSIDLVEAYAWYAIAAASGDADAERRAQNLAERLTSSERALGDDKAAQFTPAPLDPVANGVVDTVEAGALSRTRAVAEAQDMLETLGYDPGAADGSMGPRTETAIIAFQRSQGLPETGRVDAILLERLRLTVGR